MNKKINLDYEVIRSVIKENKDFLLPIFAILISLMLIIFFVIPQVNGIFQTQSQVVVENEKLTNLQKSLSVLQGTDLVSLNNEIKTSSAALPPTKDFALILDSLSSDASIALVSLGDFEFQVGDLSKQDLASTTPAPSLKLTINLTGSIDDTIKFIELLYKNAPVSEVVSLKAGPNFSSLDILFYYKPFPPQSTTNPENIRGISSRDLQLINSISTPDVFDQIPLINTDQSPVIPL